MGFVDSFQEEIWKNKYQYNNETYEQFCYRIAGNIFSEDEERKDALVELLAEFRGLFGGRINSNIGIAEEGLTLFNCFIEALGENPDSLEGIMETVTKYALTLKSEGGVGFCADFFRPANTIIRKVGVTSPGAIKFLEIFDKVSEVITSGNVDKDSSFQGVPTKNSIRKGATMVTMSVSHPDIEDFISAKSVPNRLTKMNMSVLVTDAFMECVKNDWDWDLWFPDINFEKYDEEWNGVFIEWAEKGYPTVIYKKVRAKELWELILKNSYNRSEPGIIFIDNARRMDNLHYLEGGNIVSSNPCSEIFGNTGISNYLGNDIQLGDVCCLGSVNLTKYYNIEEKKFCTDKMKKDIDLMVRALDNVIDISKYPLPMYEDAAKLKRKVGIGFMGLGSLMMMMNIRYGSDECMDILEPIMKEFINQAYQTSALMAKEKGPFELYSEELLNDGYVKNSKVLTTETIDLIRKYGLRNSAVSAVAPTGSIAIAAGNVSGGLEPVFAKEFTRWNRVEGKKVDFEYPNIYKGEWFETDYLKETKVGDEKILLSTDGEYRIDKNTGLCRKITIMDHGYRLGRDAGNKEFACAEELSVDEHLKVLSIVGKHIDMSCSKCIALNTRINTNIGVVKIGNLSSNRKLDTFSSLGKGIVAGVKDRSNSVTQFYYNGFVEGISIVTDTGQQLEGSRIHNIKVLDDNHELVWKQLKDITEDDIIAIKLGGDLSKRTIISNIIGSDFTKPSNCMPIEIPTQLSKDLLWWLGCVQADGNVNPIGVHLTQVGGNVLDRYVSISEKLFGKSPTIVKDKRRDNLFKASISSKILSHWMDYIGFSKESISEIVFSAPPSMKKSYIEGITLDGYISQKQLICLKCDKSIGLIKDLQIVCNNIGIATNIHSKFNSDYNKYYYELQVIKSCIRYMNNFIFPEEHKQNLFLSAYNSASYTRSRAITKLNTRIPVNSTFVDITNKIEKEASYSTNLYSIFHKIHNDAKKYKSLTLNQINSVYTFIGGIPDIFKQEGYLFTKVSKINNVYIETVDIEVEDSHSYIANGFISHNTINLPNNISFENFKNIYGKIHEYGIKGCTTYRAGTSVAILEAVTEKKDVPIKEQQERFLEVFKEHEDEDIIFENTKLPEEYPAKGFILRGDGKKYYIHVAFKDKACTRPFAIFVNTNHREDNTLTFNALEKLEDIAKFKGIPEKYIKETKRKYAYQKNSVKIGRMLGLLLRHNINILTIVKGLDELEAYVGTFVFQIKKFLSKFVPDHEIEGMVCPECGKKDIVFKEGCFMCNACMYSRCG